MKEAQRVIDQTVDRVINDLKNGGSSQNDSRDSSNQRNSSGGRAASGVRGS